MLRDRHAERLLFNRLRVAPYVGRRAPLLQASVGAVGWLVASDELWPGGWLKCSFSDELT